MNPERSTFKHLSTKDFGKPPTRQYNALQNLTKPHVDSFDQMLHGGLSRAAQNILPFEFSLPNGSRVSLLLQDAMIGQPMISPGNQHARTLKVFPAECRGRRTTYKAALQVKFYWTVNDKSYGPEERIIGEVPIMVKSAVCSLASLNPAKLIERGEEAQEMGGYFIVNGNERIIRMLIMPRRNFPLATCRPNWTKRGPHYTEYGITMRCVQPDETASQMVLHYLSNGAANLSFRCNKEQFFVPLIMILKALVNVKDRFIYQEMIKGVKESSYLKGCVSNMLRQAQAEGLATQAQVLKYIGERFRIKLDLPEWYSDRHIGEFLLKQCICTHLENNMEKFYTLVYMTKKLFALAKGECAVENSDNPMFQEVLLPGHLYQMLLKEKLEMWLGSVKKAILSRAEKEGTEYVLNSVAMVKALNHTSNVGKAMEYFMATGTLISKSGLGLMQNTGLTVVADKLNFMRYISHFRCVHRGSFFSEMRTTSVRKLLPEAWGFMCPVHTPDGAPCGLLNHLTGSCEIVTAVSCIIKLPYILWENGMTSYDCDPPGEAGDALPVMLDGKMVGWISQDEAPKFVQQLRAIKVSAAEGLLSLKKTEIVLVPKTKFASQYPGVYLFTSTARFVRPVKNLAYNCVEMIGSFEQVYMNICVVPEEAIPEVTTHMEISENSILSAVASLTPFSDFNQSPRNMYQCQMGKQTMGTPLHAFRHRSDNKLYRIQTPQSALVRPYMYDYYHMDEYPSGTNAVVAVISYTGYDMEDAMILNKASYERGFGHGSIYKYEIIDLQELSRDKGRIVLKFGCRPDNSRIDGRLDEDGLPAVGTYLQFGDPYYSYINIQTGVDKLATFNSKEAAYVDHIKLLGDDKGTQELQKVCVCLRIPRNPTIGDKFSSRHGQKGICSQKWPVEDMPFTEKGMTPDIIFNPHGFPSRMTIGMMIESMAGKSASSHGLCHDATAFTFSEDQSAIEYFGEMLTAAGYNYYGTERMYSGINGLELEADIFIGVVYYQRLRHMVFDKFQVRTTGPVDILTHQPVKGRKMGGGVRFGEMERDALLAHGTSFLLQDRLLNCSDKSEERVCTKCGSLLSVYQEKQASSTAAASYEARRKWICKMCNRSDTVEVISLPFVFRYLVAELAAMNIKVVLDVGPVTSPVTSHEES